MQARLSGRRRGAPGVVIAAAAFGLLLRLQLPLGFLLGLRLPMGLLLLLGFLQGLSSRCLLRLLLRFPLRLLP